MCGRVAHYWRMPRLLPIVLTDSDLPVPELLAARLDGEVYSVGTAWAPIDEIDDPLHRAVTLATDVHGRLIAEQLTAAWVWGALPTTPGHLQLCASIGARVTRRSTPWSTVREVVIADADIVTLGPIAVTSTMRTIVDLLRFFPRFDARERGVIRALMSAGHHSTRECAIEIDSRRNLPGKRLALARLAGVNAIHVVHSVDSPHGVENTIEVSRVAHLEHEPAEREALA